MRWGMGQQGTKLGSVEMLAHAHTHQWCAAILAAAEAQRPSLTFEEEERLESKDQALGSLLDRLGGSIHGKALNISPTKVGGTLGVCARMSVPVWWGGTSASLPDAPAHACRPACCPHGFSPPCLCCARALALSVRRRSCCRRQCRRWLTAVGGCRLKA